MKPICSNVNAIGSRTKGAGFLSWRGCLFSHREAQIQIVCDRLKETASNREIFIQGKVHYRFCSCQSAF